jgi:hypothetical protein
LAAAEGTVAGFSVSLQAVVGADPSLQAAVPEDSHILIDYFLAMRTVEARLCAPDMKRA